MRLGSTTIVLRPNNSQAARGTAPKVWDACEVIFIDFLERVKTINSEYYANLLHLINDEIKKKRPHLAKKRQDTTMHQLTYQLL